MQVYWMAESKSNGSQTWNKCGDVLWTLAFEWIIHMCLSISCKVKTIAFCRFSLLINRFFFSSTADHWIPIAWLHWIKHERDNNSTAWGFWSHNQICDHLIKFMIAWSQFWSHNQIVIISLNLWSFHKICDHLIKSMIFWTNFRSHNQICENLIEFIIFQKKFDHIIKFVITSSNLWSLDQINDISNKFSIT